ncbi:hypothetical protein [Pseudoxanthomonas koreensis]|uniref:hypothetical protein n=1 Tax=Pseudoxanthomonas koreensis TaxID=266061 RepID=UPI0035A67426
MNYGVRMSTKGWSVQEMHWKVTRQKMAERNILFDEDETYMERLIQTALPGSGI